MSDTDILDLETLIANGHPVPPGKRYRIRVDAARFVVESPISGRAILKLAEKSPDEWDVILKLHPHGQRVIGPDELVDLTTPGVERFVTMKRQVTDGDEVAHRRLAALRAADTAFLNSLGVPWETLKDGATTLVLIREVPLPAELEPVGPDRHAAVSVCFRLDGTYPDTQIDMAFFLPALKRTDGRPIPNVSPAVVDGASWQQWSRHRPDVSAWRPDIDGIDTHYAFMLGWLTREVSR